MNITSQAQRLKSVVQSSDEGNLPLDFSPIKREDLAPPEATVDWTSGNRAVWDVVFPNSIKPGVMYYQEEFMFRSPKLFIPSEPFEYTLDTREAVLSLTTLGIARLRYTASEIMVRLAMYIRVPENLSTWSPKINIRCLPGTSQSWYISRRCQLRVFKPHIAELCAASDSYSDSEDEESVDLSTDWEVFQ